MRSEKLADIIDIDSARPHVHVVDPRRKIVHVVPESALEDYAAGKLDAFDDPDLLRAIVGEWLAMVRGEVMDV